MEFIRYEKARESFSQRSILNNEATVAKILNLHNARSKST